MRKTTIDKDKELIISDFINKVAESFNRTREEISDTRKYEAVSIRTAIMTILQREASLTSAEAAYFFNKDHTTALYAITSHESLVKTNHRDYLFVYNKIKAIYIFYAKEQISKNPFDNIMNQLNNMENQLKIMKELVMSANHHIYGHCEPEIEAKAEVEIPLEKPIGQKPIDWSLVEDFKNVCNSGGIKQF